MFLHVAMSDFVEVVGSLPDNPLSKTKNPDKQHTPTQSRHTLPPATHFMDIYPPCYITPPHPQLQHTANYVDSKHVIKICFAIN